jgi:hypothetical protein
MFTPSAYYLEWYLLAGSQMLTLITSGCINSDALVAFAVPTLSRDGIIHTHVVGEPLSGLRHSMLNNCIMLLFTAPSILLPFHLRICDCRSSKYLTSSFADDTSASPLLSSASALTLGMPSAMHPQSTGYARHATRS